MTARQGFYENSRRPSPQFTFKSEAINSRKKWTQRKDVYCTDDEAAWLRMQLDKRREESKKESLKD